MKVVYIAFDGTEFYNKDECKNYESTKIRNNIVMIDRNGEITSTPRNAALVWLKDEEATEVFHALAQEVGYEDAANTIDKDDYGVFYWDVRLDEYHYLPLDVIDNLNALKNAVAEIGYNI